MTLIYHDASCSFLSSLSGRENRSDGDFRFEKGSTEREGYFFVTQAINAIICKALGSQMQFDRRGEGIKMR